MKRITYKTMMNKINDGYAEITAWVGNESHNECYAQVTFINNNGSRRQEMIQVVNIPDGFQK